MTNMERCPTCGAVVRIVGKTTMHYEPIERGASPYLAVLLRDAMDVRPTWSFDEQQADPIHNSWTWEKAKEELQRLLNVSGKETK